MGNCFCCGCFSLRKVYIERIIQKTNKSEYIWHVEPKYINIDKTGGKYKSRNHTALCLLKNKDTNKILVNGDTFREQGIRNGSHMQVIYQNQPFIFD
jgi:hypothetical protein